MLEHIEGRESSSCLFYLSPLCSGVSPPLPQLGQLLRPNPWQSKHLRHLKSGEAVGHD